jgi:alpha-tubulin suppressor-like RCC1 family protein
MKTSLKALCYALFLSLLVACGGYEDDGAPPELLGASDGSTSLFLAVEASTPSLRASGRVRAGRAPVTDLTQEAFRPVALVPDSAAPGGFREVNIGVFEFENRGDGRYRVAIDGEPRVNVVIFATVNGVTFKYLVIEPGSESEPLAISIESTAATELYLDAVSDNGGFDGVDEESARDAFRQTLDLIESSQPPAPDEDPLDYFKNQVTSTCDVSVTSTASNCPRKVRGTVSGLSDRLRLELNGDEEVELNASGAFEFAGLLPFGADFSVSVKDQPSGFACQVVSGGSGVIGTNDSYSVVVQCSASGTFAVGGTVSGLIGSLDLALNDQSETIDGNGFGNFSQQLVSGTAYTVTISRQPTGQTCSLQNATGVIAAAPVTNILVNCVSNQYTVGGSISGLTGNLTLLLNGANSLQVSGASQIFTFASTVPFNSQYAVSVGTQPSGQICSVSSQTASGVMPAANVTTVQVTCGDQFLVSAAAINGSITSGGGLFTGVASTTFAGTANAGYYFEGVEGCGGSPQTNTDQSQTTFSYPVGPISQACTVTATFALKTSQVTTTATNGSITSPLNPSVGLGLTTTVTGTADPNYYFAGVSGCGGSPQSNSNQSQSTFSYQTGVITGDCSVDALFLTKTFIVTTSATNGQVTSAASPLVNFGATTTVSVTANEGYYLSSMSGCNGSPFVNAEQSITSYSYTTGAISADCSVSATFSLKSYAVSTSVSNGSLTPSTSPVMVMHGNTTTISATANQGYYLASVQSTCGGTVPPSSTDETRKTLSYTTGAITSGCSVTFGTAVQTPRSIGGELTGITRGAVTLALRQSAQGAVLGTATLNAELSPAADFGFTSASLPVRLLGGDTYAVEVATQPLEQYCEVKDGSGTVGNGEVTSVRIQCASLTGYLSGTWARNSGGQQYLFRYRTNGEYVVARATPGSTAQTGMEFGSFLLNDDTGSVLSVAASLDQVPEGISHPGFGKRISFRNDNLVITSIDESTQAETEEEWTRVENDPLGLAGTWENFDQSTETFFITFFADVQRYMILDLQLSATHPPCEAVGVEYGSYAYDPVARTLTVSNNLVDTNGCAGGHDNGNYDTLTGISLVDLDGNTGKLDGLRLVGPGGNPDILKREGFFPLDIESFTFSIVGTWSSFQSLSPTVTYPPNSREVYRFDLPDAILQRTSYLNGFAGATGSGLEGGRFEYNPATGLVRVFVGLDTNGSAAGLDDEANVDVNGNPIPGTTVDSKVFLFVENGGSQPDVLHAYDYVNDIARAYVRGPQRLSGELAGTWVEGNESFFSPTTVFFPDGSYMLLDPKGQGPNGCSPAQPGIELGRWALTGSVPDTLDISLDLPASVADTNGCAGLWNTVLQASNVAGEPIIISGGNNPDSVNDDSFMIFDSTFYKVPNNGTVPLQSNYVVRGTASLDGATAIVTLRDGQGNNLGTQELTGVTSFEFAVALSNQSGWQLEVGSNTSGKQCSATPSSGVINGADGFSEIVCGPITVGGSVTGLRQNEILLMAVKKVSAQFTPPATLFLEGTSTGTLPFTFQDTAFVSGDQYEISVTSAPERRYCRVTNGTGTVGFFNITNVEVSCFDNIVEIGAIRPSTPVIGSTVSVSGFGFQGATVSLGGVPVTPTFQSNHEVRFVVPAVDEGTQTLNIIKLSGQVDVGGDSRNVDIASRFRVSTDPAVKKAVALGSTHTCAIGIDFNVYCWGTNLSGQLGVDPANLTTRAQPVEPVAGITNARSLAAGADHTCVLLSDTTVKCWGSNNTGQIGTGAPGDSIFAPLTVIDPGTGLPLANVSHLAAGENHTCAVAAGQMYCWGANEQSQIDGGNASTLLAPTVLFTPGSVLDLVAGAQFTCVQLFGESLACWGRNEYGQLGIAPSTSIVLPANPVTTPDVRDVSAGKFHVCTVSVADGKVRCRGDNTYGQLFRVRSGPNALASSTELLEVFGVEAYPADISAGPDFGCASLAAGLVKCWGANVSGQLGNGQWDGFTAETALQLEDVLDVANASTLYVGGNFDTQRTCALVSGGGLRCWGARNSEFLRGDAEQPLNAYSDAVTLPVSAVAAVATGGRDQFGLPYHPGGSARTCVLQAGAAQQAPNSVLCAGTRTFLGDDGVFTRSVFRPVDGLGNPLSLALGDLHSCASNDAGSIFCWGDPSNGAFGSSPNFSGGPLLQLPTIAGFLPASPATGKVLSAGSGHTCARADDGLYCWGNNTLGQLGSTLQGTSFLPEIVAGLGTVDDFDLGGDFSCAVVAGNVRCWGDNSKRQLGIPAFAGPSSSSPGIVSGPGFDITNAFKVSAGLGHACAIVGTGTVRCWGDNADGQVGQPFVSGVNQLYATAELVPGVTEAVDLAAGDVDTCAVLSGSGRVYCWGYDHRAAQNFSFRYIRGAGLAESVSVGRATGCARVSSTEAQCWGKNFEGELAIPLVPNVVRQPVPGL